MQIVRQVPAGADWQQAEKEEIARHRALGCALTNATDGGEPGGAAKWDKQELRERALAAKSESAKRQWGDRATRARMMAGMHTAEAKARRAAATSKRMSDPDGLLRHSETMKAVAQRPEARQQIQAASRKRWAAYRAANPPPPPPTEEELRERAELKRERQRQSARARWQREGEIEKHRAIVWTPERRAAQAKALDARREKMNAGISAEGRARQAEAMRRIWAERKAAAAQ